MLSFESGKILDKLLKSDHSDIDHMSDIISQYTSFIEASGWTMEEFNTALIKDIDAGWDEIINKLKKNVN
jgi:hypothetical protein